MSAKFTPGEWRVCELTRRFGVYDSSSTSIAKVDGAYGVAMERRKADAHLIAAAPDLYEALSAFVSWCDADEEGPQYSSPDRRDGPNGEAEWLQWWNGQLELAARSHLLGSAALKKARGES